MITVFSLTRSLIRSQSTVISRFACAESDDARSTGPLQAAIATAVLWVGHGCFAGVAFTAEVDPFAEPVFELPEAPQPASIAAQSNAISDQTVSVRLIPSSFQTPADRVPETRDSASPKATCALSC